MPIDAFVAPLTLLAVAWPFVFSYTAPPLANFWPVLGAWACMLLLAALAGARAAVQRRGAAGGLLAAPGGTEFFATQFALGLLLAAILAGGVGLVQYFWGDVGLAPWVQPSTPGQAIGNLRQRNQQATLLALGAWALLWLVAQAQAQAQQRPPAYGAKNRHGPLMLAGILMAWALAWIALASAATTSRTGALQWLVIVALLALWRRSTGRLALGLAVVGVLLYLVWAWLLPGLLLQWTGFQAEDLFMRFGGEGRACVSRRVLWSNVLYLIAQKPWTGWGWGELDYAHYMTLFPGARFCLLLDNAHDLPLHLAVELGVPVALLACAAVLAWVWRARPWRETAPARQLAWGVLALIGLHSLLEFPLWYGPFQLAALFAVALLWRGLPRFWERFAPLRYGVALVLAGILALGAYAAWDYWRVSQIYLPVSERTPALRENTIAKVSDTLFFADSVDFALLTSMPLSAITPANAAQTFALAQSLLHFSPEPRVIEPLIVSARLLGRSDVAAEQELRYRIAYPADYARWHRREHPAQGGVR